MTLQAMSFIFGALLLAVGILGGGFEVQQLKVATATPATRIAASLVGIVFVVLGFTQSLPSWIKPADPVAPTTAAVMSEGEHDTNRYGGDFNGFDIGTDRVEDCEQSCKAEGRCLAWTYVKPGLHGSQARCYLKNVIPVASKNDCCVSGTKVRGQ